jgi:hypothetical protein
MKNWSLLLSIFWAKIVTLPHLLGFILHNFSGFPGLLVFVNLDVHVKKDQENQEMVYVLSI